MRDGRLRSVSPSCLHFFWKRATLNRNRTTEYFTHQSGIAMSPNPIPIPAAAFAAEPSPEGIPLTPDERRAALPVIRKYIKEGPFYQGMKADEVAPSGTSSSVTFITGPAAVADLMGSMLEQEYSIYLMDEARAIAKGVSSPLSNSACRHLTRCRMHNSQAQRDATTLLVILAKIEKMRGKPKPAYTQSAPYAAVRVKHVLKNLGKETYACADCSVGYREAKHAEQCCRLSDPVTCRPECAFPDVDGAAACCEPGMEV